jgi:phosphoglycolate phosphatase-like HAD superfamily hydrolase
MQSEPLRVLYFDIDGTLTDYDDAPKAAFAGGALEQALKDLSFDRLFCVSGWADPTANAQTRAPEEHRARAIHDLLRPVFPDRDWFLSRLALGTDTDHRCRQIDLTTDWWYADDWADKFFVEHFGRELYERELGKRVLRVDPFTGGSDVLAWLTRIPVST